MILPEHANWWLYVINLQLCTDYDEHTVVMWHANSQHLHAILAKLTSSIVRTAVRTKIMCIHVTMQSRHKGQAVLLLLSTNFLRCLFGPQHHQLHWLSPASSSVYVCKQMAGGQLLSNTKQSWLAFSMIVGCIHCNFLCTVRIWSASVFVECFWAALHGLLFLRA